MERGYDIDDTFLLLGLVKGFAPPHCPHRGAGKGCQVNIIGNDKLSGWVLQNDQDG